MQTNRSTKPHERRLGLVRDIFVDRLQEHYPPKLLRSR